MIHLVVTRGPDAPLRQTFLEFPILIGRDPSNSLNISDPEVSRFHTRIKRRGSTFVIEDLGSKNGCYINGQKTLNSVVQNNDKILLGNTELLFATSTESINFAADIINFNMIIDEEKGINGPINLSANSDIFEDSKIRVNQASILNKMNEIEDYNLRIYEQFSNLLAIENLEEASKAMLKSIAMIDDCISRAALFIWSSHNQQLIPTSTQIQHNDNRSFYLNTKAMQQAIVRRQGVVLSSKNQSSGDRHRLILPMIHANKTYCIFHLEIDNHSIEIPPQLLEALQAFIELSRPKYESLVLRNEIDALMLGMVEAMIATIEAKDTYTVGHSERVCRYSMDIANELHLNPEIKKMLMISALCHDIGKIGIPDAILKKAALLSPEEYQEMKLHPTIGAEIISNIPNAERFMSGVKYHHEKWDGTGYPDGLEGEDIPFFGRIVAVADVFDAMISGRSYSGFIDESEAIEKIQKEVELFDPEIVKALVRAFERGSLTQRTSTVGKKPS